MQTKKYAPLILALLTAILAVVYLVNFFASGDLGAKWYMFVTALLFGGAALTSFMKNSDMKIGWYLYIASFVFWIITQFFTIHDFGGFLAILPYVLVGAFIVIYLLDDEVIASFSYEFSLNK